MMSMVFYQWQQQHLPRFYLSLCLSLCFELTMETMRATGLVCQSSLVEFKRSSLPRKTLTPHPPTGSRVSLPFRNHGSLLLLRMAEHSKIPMAISQNASLASQLVSVKNKITNPIVVIDNYDSVTYNLCQYMGELGCNFEVYRNDELTVDELKKKNPRGVLISPGPGTPQDSGISLQTVLELGPTVPLFGVCMGLQCIGEAFGGKIVRSPHGVMHKKSSLVYHNEGGEDGLFSGLSNPCLSSGVLKHFFNIFTSTSRQAYAHGHTLTTHMGTHSPWALPLAIAIYNHKFSLS
ncbi:anthranilate synthase beta subunit 1, chloroplastic-like [Camellia sinensis]|uniref:anthranilate synthase beta subunit 1, chloroplastic-like n=1 Tax=Camellia sinensis TaxID=4442 RepID=UPI001036544C|nr:anthranilate synthase beta subunit 1, chloroplastic-like [Camellia sinensis]